MLTITTMICTDGENNDLNNKLAKMLPKVRFLIGIFIFSGYVEKLKVQNYKEKTDPGDRK